MGGSWIRPRYRVRLRVFSPGNAGHEGGRHRRQDLLVSGSGNVAQYTVAKLYAGRQPVTLSDSYGCVYDEEEYHQEKMQ
jgi:glutamate dehydrogenase/leucine dehydrogenase